MEMAGYGEVEERRREARSRGELLGVGMSNTTSPAGGGMFEHAEIRFDPSGSVTLLTGSMDHGQGHGTTFKQILSEKLGLDADLIRYKYGDTDAVTNGIGTFGSRSTVLAGSAISLAADKIVEKGRNIAAHFLEAAVGDISFEKGKFVVTGTDKFMNINDVAKNSFKADELPNGLEPGFAERADYANDIGGTFPNGAHICEVEIDEETGKVALTRYAAVDDVGVVINPLLVDGLRFRRSRILCR